MILKKGQQKKFIPIPKHPLKVHIWSDISARGATQIVIFTDKLHVCATKLLKMFKVSLVPFITKVYDGMGWDGMQDKDPKHCRRLARLVLNKQA